MTLVLAPEITAESPVVLEMIDRLKLELSSARNLKIKSVEQVMVRCSFLDAAILQLPRAIGIQHFCWGSWIRAMRLIK
jgi:hypothetical protein